jgi:hypothetical protein
MRGMEDQSTNSERGKGGLLHKSAIFRLSSTHPSDLGRIWHTRRSIENDWIFAANTCISSIYTRLCLLRDRNDAAELRLDSLYI